MVARSGWLFVSALVAVLSSWAETSVAAARDAAMSCVSIRSAVERLDCFDAAYADIDLKDDRAAVVCSEAIRQNSISPATYRYVRSWIASDVVFVVFDAQNMYGALLRNNASCHFTKSGNSWNLASPAEFVISAISLGPIPADETSLQEPAISTTSEQDAPKVIPPSPGDALASDDDRQNKCVTALDLTKEGVEEVKKWPNPDGTTTFFVRPVKGKVPFRMGVCDYAADGRLSVRVNRD